MDSLVYSSGRSIEQQYIDKGIIQGFDVVLNLVEFLYSTKLKEENTNFPSTRPDDE
jgi:hypothetical protein